MRYPLSWSDASPHPSSSPTLHDIFGTTSTGLQAAKASQQLEDAMLQALPPTTRRRAPTRGTPHAPYDQDGNDPTSPHHPGGQWAPGYTTRIGGPKRPTPMGQNHTGTPSHPPQLGQQTPLHLSTRSILPPPPPHRARGTTITPEGRDTHNGNAYPRCPHTLPRTVSAHNGAPRPHSMASHRHHLLRPRLPHAHLAAQIGGHLLRPPAKTPGSHKHPTDPPSSERDSPGCTQHTHPGVVRIRDAHKRTGGGGHWGHPVHPTSVDWDPAPQQATRLYHPVGIPRPRHSHPRTWSPFPPPSSKPRQRQPLN